MKLKIILLLIVVVCMSSVAKKNVLEKGKRELVKVKNWGKVIFLIPENYWENKSGEIIQQIGEKEFQKVKRYSDYRNIPCQMLIFCGGKKKDTSELYKKQNEMKLYKIASYTHFNNNGENRGQWAILQVPYSENKNWDSTAKWDTVYFVIRNEYVEVLD